MTTKKNDDIEKEYFEDVVLTDPITGKTFTQKVKIIRYKTAAALSKSVLDEIEEDSQGVVPEVDLENDEE
jgi:hypothetical protein